MKLKQAVKTIQQLYMVDSNKMMLAQTIKLIN